MSDYTPSPIMRYFEFRHLPDGPARLVSAKVKVVATSLDKQLPSGPEKATALRKLLEAKDAGMRAALEQRRLEQDQ